jgi:SAM-dependent methyltransferase
MSSHQPARERFSEYYATPKAPWDIGRPQRAFVEAGDEIRGRVLDSGCGTGDLALWLAEHGCTVTGVDFLEKPIALARQKAADRGLAANFLQMDALAIGEIPERFDAATDCGLFHTFDDTHRAAYESGDHGPRRVSEAELRAAFAKDWEVEKIEPSRFEVVPGIAGAEFTPGGAKAWFATIRRA